MTVLTVSCIFIKIILVIVIYSLGQRKFTLTFSISPVWTLETHPIQCTLCPTVQLSNYQTVQPPKCQTVQVSTCPLFQLSYCSTVHLSNCQTVKLSNSPKVHLSNCLTVQLSNLPTFQHTSIRLRFSCYSVTSQSLKLLALSVLLNFLVEASCPKFPPSSIYKQVAEMALVENGNCA